MELISIGDAAARLGMRTSALRYSDDRGLVAPSARRGGFLTHALHCPSEHPARECRTMVGTLDRLAAGLTVEQLAAEQLGPHPPGVD